MDSELSPTEIVIRSLDRDDCARLVAIDEHLTGRTRSAWYAGKLKRALTDSDLRISLGAECDGYLVGAMLATLYYGEFGQPEPVAVLDTVLVDPAWARRGVARALFEQLATNLRALRIDRLRTEVDWNHHDLVAFFSAAGFVPVPRLVLEAALEPE